MRKILWLILKIIILIAAIFVFISLEIRMEDVNGMIICYEKPLVSSLFQENKKPIIVDPPEVSRDKYASKTRD